MLDALHKHETATRRRQLADLIGEDSIAIVAAAPQAKRNGDGHHRYRQNSDFFYLTGFNEHDAVMVVAPGRAAGEFILFCRDRDPDRERWDGVIMGVERAGEWVGADDAFPIDDIDDILPGLIEGREKVYSAFGDDFEFDQRLMGWVNRIRARTRTGALPPSEFVALSTLLHEMRLHKSAHEIELMRAAARVAVRAQTRMMQKVHPGMMEYQLGAELAYELAYANCEEPYTSIIGGGKNACILHYIENNQLLHDGELVLVDAGAEFQCYASDITRTYPVNGKFTAEQKALYEVVLAANEAAIEATRAGQTFQVLNELAVKVLTEGLVDLKLLKGKVDDLIESQAYRRFYMHSLGHWLGLDTHDVGEYKLDGQSRALAPGMVITIEPGLYIDDGVDVPEGFRNTGVRIEDNLHILPNGIENLTVDCVKSVADIEAIVGQDADRK